VSKVILVGTISNAGKKLESDFYKVFTSLHFFDQVDVFLVESDSSDSTIEVLNKISKKTLNFNYITLGNLKDTIPNRIERIRNCRNEYVKFIRDNINVKKWDYVVVADLDGMNKCLRPDALKNLFTSRIDWDGCFANQKYGYYDIYALRHDSWMPNDCFEDLRELKNLMIKGKVRKFQILKKLKLVLAHDLARKISIYDKMRVLNRKSDWIEVNSAFGGLGIYKTNWFLKFDYTKLISNNPLVSEHVDFNLKCSNQKARFYIVPGLINNNWNEYNVMKIFLIRQLRMLLSNIFSKNRNKL